MAIYKCKKSVFCICFLIFFFLGTISGVFSFRCLLSVPENPVFIGFDFSRAAMINMISFLCSALRPLFIAALFALHPLGYTAVFPLIFTRAFLLSYCFSAAWFIGCGFWPALLKDLVVLPLFYCLCRWTYFRWDGS